MRVFNSNAQYSQLGYVVDINGGIRDQLIYNAQPRYNLSQEILRTKILPTDVDIVNGAKEVIEAETPPINWGPLAIAAATIYFAMG